MKISHSAKERYQTCPRSYFNHYFRKLRPEEKKSALAFGDAIDLGLNSLLETRDLDVAKRAFQVRWNEYKTQDIKYSKADGEEIWLCLEGDPSTPWHVLRYKGLIQLEEYNEQVMPLLEDITKTQIEEDVPNGDGDILTVKTDFIAKYNDKIVLFDNKTTSVKYKQSDVKASAQLSTYYEVLKEKYNLEQIGFITIPKKINKKKLPRIKIEILVDEPEESTIVKTFDEYASVLADIKEAKFEKNLNSCVGIYGKCGYYDYCRNGSTKGLIEKS